jgi:hypothetical protein
MKTSLPVLTATLHAAAHDAALCKQMADVTLLAVNGFNPARTGNAAIEARETAVALVAALDVVITAAAVEVSDNVVRFGARA